MASPKCLGQQLADNVSMTLPLCEETLKGKDAVLSAITRWVHDFHPYNISSSIITNNCVSFAETSVWYSKGVHSAGKKDVTLHGATQFLFDQSGKLLHIHVHFNGTDLKKQLQCAENKQA